MHLLVKKSADCGSRSLLIIGKFLLAHRACNFLATTGRFSAAMHPRLNIYLNERFKEKGKTRSIEVEFYKTYHTPLMSYFSFIDSFSGFKKMLFITKKHSALP